MSRLHFLSVWLILVLAVPAYGKNSDFNDPSYRLVVSAYEKENHEETIRLATPLAESGHEGAMFVLATTYWDHINKEKGIYWHSKAASHGVPLSQYFVGYLFYEGKYVEQDLKVAVRWLEQSAKSNFVDAQSLLAYMYYLGETEYGIQLNKAHKWALLSAEAGDAESQTLLGLMYSFEDLGEPNYYAAKRWYEKAAEQNVAVAELGLGEIYEYGLSVPADLNKALEYYELAQLHGSTEADKALDRVRSIINSPDELFKSGLSSWESGDFRKAYGLFMSAAKNGHDQAMVWVGFMYETGKGVEKDLALARNNYENAAKAGNSAGMYNLGLWYKNRVFHHLDGVKPKLSEYERAVYLRRYEEKQGKKLDDVTRANWIQYGNFSGKVVDFDAVEKARKNAVVWFFKAGKKGHAKAYHELGNIYELGVGGKRDFIKAYIYYSLAGELGGNDSNIQAELMEMELSSAELKKAKAKIKNSLSAN